MASNTDAIGILASLIQESDQATPQLASPRGQPDRGQGPSKMSAPATTNVDSQQPPSSQQEVGVSTPSIQEAIVGEQYQGG